MVFLSKSVYIHVPFCSQICHYCDFNKFLIDAKNQPVDDYLRALQLEMQRAHVHEVQTVFIGGGTPTALSPVQLIFLLQAIREHVPFHDDAEFTIEANPNDLTDEKLAILRKYGVNRLSIGVQSFCDDLLREIGRDHLEGDVLQAIRRARAFGFDNISLDLIHALPNQSLEMLTEDLNKAIALDVEHLSVYSLLIEPKTVFYQRLARGEMVAPVDGIDADMYQLVMDRLEQAGFKQYEISNYARDGFFSRHNMVYWDNAEYYGFGAGAHGYLDGVRYGNLNVLKKYMAAIYAGHRPILSEHIVSKHEQMEEAVFLGLRKCEGVSLSAFYEQFGATLFDTFPGVVEQLMDKGLLETDGIFIRLTMQGKLIGNEVFQQFLG